MHTFTLNYKYFGWLLASTALIGMIIAPALSRGDEPHRKIVVFDEHFLNDAAKDELLARHGAVKVKDLDLINSKAVILPGRAAERALAQDSRVKRIDDDVIVTALEVKHVRAESRTSTQPPQSLWWGVDRVDADLVWPGGNVADTIKVGIIDTGISKDHPDLKANIKGGVNTINPRKGWNDDNGHGSHVAGIVAAANNSIGVIGVAHQADLYAIKVLGANGSGYLSDVIEGIDWAIANGVKVVNMSLGTASNVQSFRDAVVSAYNAGVVVVAAAGNSGGAVNYPAAYPETIAVSATDSNNAIASWSSRGPEVDLASPGVGIYSTYKGTGYATLSGTSMAAPHVAGSVALVMNTLTDTAFETTTGTGTTTVTTCVSLYDTNCNYKWDPAEVQKKLQDRAVDLGDAGYDTLYGWGLVNAYQAVQ